MRFLLRQLCFFAVALASYAAAPTKLGDLDGDGLVNVYDLTRLRSHIRGTATLPESLVPFADVTGDGFINEDDAVALINTITGKSLAKTLPLASIRETSPFAGESTVALTREVIARFTQPLSLNTVLTTWDSNTQTLGHFYAEAGGAKLRTRVELSGDREKATLFFLDPVPASTRVTVTFDATSVNDLLERPLDPEADSAAGGTLKFTYDTAPITAVAGTGVIGHVYASERGAGGVNVPIPGVLVRVVGSETLFTHTAADGSFSLNPCPAGRFFVEVDGRTSPASDFPAGAYYPYINKPWETLPGKADNLAAGTGIIYLPLIPAATLTRVSATQQTTITSTSPILAGVEIYVPPNSLFSDDGTRGGKVGIAPVASDRLPEPLPPGLNHALDISIQTDGATNFDRPVPVKFPNLPDPVTGVKLKPGEKSALWSYNHDKGVWEIVGPMTVTDDGEFVVTDVGVGVTQPGWHGTNQGTQGEGPKQPPVPSCPDHSLDAAEILALLDSIGDCLKLVPKAYLDYAKFFTLVADVNKYYKLFVKYKADLDAGRPDIVLIRLKIRELEADVAKLKVKLAAVTPIEKLEKIVDCAKGLLDALAPLCEGSQELPECFSWLHLRLCALRATLVTTLTNAKTAISAVKDAILGVPYSLIDSVIAEVKRALDAQVAPQAAGRLSAADAAPSLAQTLDDLIAALEPVGKIPPEQLEFASFAPLIRTLAEHNGLGGDASIEANGSFPNAYVMIETDNQQYRTRTNISGHYQMILPPNMAFGVHVFDPPTSRIGMYVGFTDGNGSRTDFHGPILSTEVTPQYTDSDDLSDAAEAIIGTNPNLADTDGDGIPDGTEIAQGTNPLDGLAVQTGVLTSIDTPGSALDVAALNNVAAVADGAGGVSVFNVANALNPVRAAQVAVAGSVESVAMDGAFAAAAGDVLALLDVGDLSAVRVVVQLSLGATPRAVAAASGVAYAGLSNGQVVAVDMATATELLRANVTAGVAIQDLAFAGEILYVRTAATVFAVKVEPGGFTVAGSVAVNSSSGGGRLRLIAGAGLAYASYSGGWTVLSLANPLQPTVAGSAATGQTGFREMVPTGSGLGVGIASLNTNGKADVELYNLGANGTDTQFLTRIVTPGEAQAASIFNGLAYIADGPAGLSVVNYIAYDNLGIPPTITLSTSFTGNAVEEGKTGRVTATVTDDVQVRAVEFFVDDQLVATDGTFPFEHRFITPRIAPGKTSFTLRGRATDTGGNATMSATVTVNLLPDATPPSVVRYAPSGGFGSLPDQSIAAYFSEPIDTASLTSATFSLTNAGPDQTFDTPDDFPEPGGSVTFNNTLLGAFLSFDHDLAPSRYRASVTTGITDAAGNALAADVTWTIRVAICEPMPPDAVGWWPGDATGVDRISGNNAVLASSVGIATGVVAQAFQVGPGKLIEVPNSPALNPSSQITVQAWIFRQTTVGSYDPILKKSDPSQTKGYALEYNGQQLYFYVYTPGGWRAAASAAALPFNQWIHVAGVYDGTRLSIYINGTLSGSAAVSGQIVTAASGLRIGNDPGNPGRWFSGLIDEVEIYSRALTSDEIFKTWEAGGAGHCLPTGP